MPYEKIGSIWWKVDFHTHTNASTDAYQGTEAVTDREWLLAHMSAGLDAVVISDHNSGDKIDPLKQELAILDTEKPEGYRKLVLFPGVEISAAGPAHILAIMDPSKSSADITQLIGAVDYPGTRGDSDGVTTKTPEKVFESIVSSGGIPIPAHFDKARGLGSLEGISLKQPLEFDDLLALEIIDKDFSPTGVLTQIKKSFAYVVGSDSHKQSEIGRHYSWVKMTTPNLDGLRLALLDGNRSVIRYDSAEIDPNTLHSALYIESMRVSESRYMGNGTPLDVKFSPWLNTIIGGRGTGKSALLNFLRLALRRENELGNEKSDLRQDFNNFAQIAAGRDDKGLLKANTNVEITYIKDGIRFKISWDQTGAAPPLLQEREDSTFIPVDGDILRRFPIRIFSQKQVFTMASKSEALMTIVDENIDKDSWISLWRAEENTFLTLRSQLRRIESDLNEAGRVGRFQLDFVMFEGKSAQRICTNFGDRLHCNLR